MPDKDQGWVKLHRKSIENGWLGNHKLWALWSYCLLKASHKNTSAIVGFRQIKLEPGQFIFGRKKAAKELKMSERAVRTSVDFLKNAGNIVTKPTNKFTIVTVCNWSTYQDNEKEERPTSDQQATNKRPTSDHIQEVKNGKNVKKKRVTSEFSLEKFNGYVSEVYDFFILTLSERERHTYGPKSDKIKFEWYDTIDKCHRLDGYPYWKIIDIIEHYREDEFWSHNFYSATKLRDVSKKTKVKRIDEWACELEEGEGLYPPKDEKDYICQKVLNLRNNK